MLAHFTQLLFFVFSALLLLSALMVILHKNPVASALFLVGAFIFSSALWMLLSAEFLSLILIVVYVGAVMTLFLFVVMMLNLDEIPLQQGFVRYTPFAVLLMGVLMGILCYMFGPQHFNLGAQLSDFHSGFSFSNVNDIGVRLYTEYAYPFELAGMLLLLAMIAAIALAFRGRQHSKAQVVAEQLAANKADRLTIHQVSAVRKEDRQ